ncbi:MAG: hypothetical protein ACOC0P_08150 [Planctomycetota bacterium]
MSESNGKLFHMTGARMLVTTWGESYDWTQIPPALVIAQSLELVGPVQKCLNEARGVWASNEGDDHMQAILAANNYVEEQLQKVLGPATIQLGRREGYYIPIRDAAGNIIGHESTSVLLRDGKTVPFTYSKKPLVEGFVTIFVAVGRE